MKITDYDLVKVTRTEGSVSVRGAAENGGSAFILADIDFRDLTYDVEHLIWRAVWGAERVAVVAYADVKHALVQYLAERSGQLETVERSDAENAADEFEAFNAILADIAAVRQEVGL